MRVLTKLGFCLNSALALAAAGCFGHQYRSGPRVAVVGGDPIVQMKPAAAFPIVTKPSLVPAGIHSDPPDEESRILGLTVGPSRADTRSGLTAFESSTTRCRPPFVVARCALAAITAVFDSRVGGRVLHFENSGAPGDTLVLRDLETGTTVGRDRAALRPARRRGSAPSPPSSRAREWERAWPARLYLDLGEDTSSRSSCVSIARRAGRESPGRRLRPAPQTQAAGLRAAIGRRGARLHPRRRSRPPAASTPALGGDLAVTWDPSCAPARLRRRRRRGLSSRCSGLPRTCFARVRHDPPSA